MYGGLSNVFGVLNDTWEWDGSNWIEKHPLNNPGGRWDHSMAYDTARSKVVLIGGLGSNDNQTWEYDGNDWANYNPVVAPTYASNIAMTYDQTIHRIVLLTYEPATINTLNRLWQWDGVTWTVRSPSSGPLVRTGATLVFDTARAKSILFGGESVLSDDIKQLKDTWQWDGVSGIWVQTISPKNPPASATAIAYDSAHREIVLFGGSTATAGGTHATNETWVLGDNDTQWTQKFPQHQPPGRLNHSLVYDSGRSVVVLFGGDGNYTAAFNDTWEWNGLDWVQKQPANSPPPRDGAAIAYDSDRGVIVMFGGRGNTLFGDTWEYDGTNWVQRFPQHSPSTRNSAGMVYDSRRHKIVLFGDYSTNSNETWEWDGTDWTLRTLPLSPSGRGLPGIAFDASRGVTVLFGGIGPGFLSDTWEYDGNTWTSITSATSPGARYTGNMAYNPNHLAVVIVGGGIPTGLMDDTWEYRSTNSPPAVDAGGPYSVGENGSVAVTASGNDPDGDAITYAWDLDNNGTFESPGQTVTFSAVGLSALSTHIIQVQATDSGGLFATDEANVNVEYKFAGFFQPVDNFPTWNELKAGRAVSVRFSLNGYKGLNIFEADYPKMQVIACTSTDPADGIEETVTAGASSLSYDASTDQYIYIWKTDKAWNTPPCRQLVIKFNDGTFQRANFKFIK